MKSNWLFYLGAGIDAFILLLSVSNAWMSRSFSQGMSGMGRVLMVVIPVALLVLIGLAFWLKSIEKIRFANILLWIPALPMAGGIVIWGGLALLFILFGK